MKNMQRILSMTLVFLLVFSVGFVSVNAQTDGATDRETVEVKFNDSEDAAWAAEYIDSMQARNVFTGYGDGTFRPNQPVTRVEAVVMAVRLMGLEDEAKQKDTSNSLHFADAQKIDTKYAWAKGYLLVALENGLFDASENSLQPEAGASRVWISSLLVRALGLQDEALKQMTTVPNFNDVNAIPAGSIGYVNVAVQQGIVTGYPNGTFQPNKSVTRAEMAALLDRTNDDLQDKIGAYTVSGVVTDITFDDTVTGDVYGGQITVKNFSDDQTATYSISSNLLIKYQDKYVQADQILVDDAVQLVVQDGVVKEGAIIDTEAIAELNVIELEIEAEFTGDREAEFEYKNKRGKIKAKVKVKEDKNKEELKGDEAKAYMEKLIADLNITSATSEEEIVEKVLATLFADADLNELKELAIEVRFSDGQKVEIEWKPEYTGELAIVELEIEAKLKNDRKVKYEYENERGDVEAKVKVESKDEKSEIKGSEAAALVEELIAELDITPDTDKEDVLEKVLAALFDADELDELKEIEIEIKFSNGKKVKVEWEQDDDDDDDDDDEDDEKENRPGNGNGNGRR